MRFECRSHTQMNVNLLVHRQNSKAKPNFRSILFEDSHSSRKKNKKKKSKMTFFYDDVSLHTTIWFGVQQKYIKSVFFLYILNNFTGGNKNRRRRQRTKIKKGFSKLYIIAFSHCVPSQWKKNKFKWVPILR